MNKLKIKDTPKWIILHETRCPNCNIPMGSRKVENFLGGGQIVKRLSFAKSKTESGANEDEDERLIFVHKIRW